MNGISLPAGEFKATCLKLMDEVAATGKSVTITKRGKAVARLVPVEQHQKNPKELFGALAHCTHIVGDISGPSGTSIDMQMAETIREWDEIEAGWRSARRTRRPARTSRKQQP